jgi:hypothetical protein
VTDEAPVSDPRPVADELRALDREILARMVELHRLKMRRRALAIRSGLFDRGWPKPQIRTRRAAAAPPPQNAPAVPRKGPRPRAHPMPFAAPIPQDDLERTIFGSGRSDRQ